MSAADAPTRDEIAAYHAARSASTESDAALAAFRADWEPWLAARGLDLDGQPLHSPDDLPFDDAIDADEAPTKDEPDHDPGPEPDPPFMSLVRIAEAEAELFSSPDRTPYAKVRVRSHKEVWPLKSSGFKEWLVRRYYESNGTVPKAQHLSDALGVINGEARFNDDVREVHLRWPDGATRSSSISPMMGGKLSRSRPTAGGFFATRRCFSDGRATRRRCPTQLRVARFRSFAT